MNEHKRLAVIFGGRSGEHEVSLMSARSMLSVLEASDFEVTQIGVTPDGRWLGGEDVIGNFEKRQYQSLHPLALLPEPRQGQLFTVNKNKLSPFAVIDVVFPLIHGTFGEDGSLQGLLELADLAYVGGGVLASAVCMDKSLFKDVMRANGIPVTDSLLVLREEVQNNPDAAIKRIESAFAYPVFVKPANLGSSVGITRCTNHSSLVEGLLEAASYDRRVIVERGVDARDLEVSVLGNENPIASVPGEVQPQEDFYSYTAKYVTNLSTLVIPAALDENISREMSAMAIKAYQAIDGAGLARVDFLLDRKSGKFYVGEINTIPGFTSISMYAKLWQAAGISYNQLIERLVQFAFDRKGARDHTVRVFRSEG